MKELIEYQTELAALLAQADLAQVETERTIENVRRLNHNGQGLFGASRLVNQGESPRKSPEATAS